MSPTTFLERLCTLVPRPGKNTILYSGVLAAHAEDRARIVPGEAATTRVHDSNWAELSRHGVGLDVLTPSGVAQRVACPCGKRMRFVEIVDRARQAPPAARRVRLPKGPAHHGEGACAPADAPRLRPVTTPPQRVREAQIRPNRTFGLREEPRPPRARPIPGA